MSNPPGASATSKLKGRWTRDAKRTRQEFKAAVEARKLPEGTGMDVSTFSERLLHCAAKAGSTSAVVVKRCCNKVEEDRNDANQDGSDILVITSSNFLIPVDDYRAPGVHNDHCNSTRTMVIVKPLLILDLNGILCHRIRKEHADLYPHLPYRTAVDRIASTPVIPRPGIVDFLEMLSEHFCLAIWTSAKPRTAKHLLTALVPESISARLLFVWSQKHCDCSKRVGEGTNDSSSTIFRKSLEKVWRNFPLWNPSNTLLLDDSPDKCPEFKNTLHPPSLHGKELLRQDGDTRSSVFLMSDEENGLRQQAFFATLVQEHFWEPRETWPNDKNQVGKAEAMLTKILHRFATSHMGWRGEQAIE